MLPAVLEPRVGAEAIVAGPCMDRLGVGIAGEKCPACRLFRSPELFRRHPLVRITIARRSVFNRHFQIPYFDTSMGYPMDLQTILLVYPQVNEISVNLSSAFCSPLIDLCMIAAHQDFRHAILFLLPDQYFRTCVDFRA